MSAHKIGTKVRLWFTCYALPAAGPKALADPTTLTVILDLLVGATVTTAWPADGAIVRVSLGLFCYEHTITEAGVHQVRGEATGALVVAEQTSFTVVAKNTT